MGKNDQNEHLIKQKTHTVLQIQCCWINLQLHNLQYIFSIGWFSLNSN